MLRINSEIKFIDLLRMKIKHRFLQTAIVKATNFAAQNKKLEVF